MCENDKANHFTKLDSFISNIFTHVRCLSESCFLCAFSRGLTMYKKCTIVKLICKMQYEYFYKKIFCLNIQF